jgi:hypothetical protein
VALKQVWPKLGSVYTDPLLNVHGALAINLSGAAFVASYCDGGNAQRASKLVGADVVCFPVSPEWMLFCHVNT